MMYKLASSRTRGMTMVEVLMASIIIGTLLVASLRVIGAARASQLKLADQSRARLLAQQLVAEIMSQPFEEPGTEGTFGLETGESADSRISYDDVDDYDSWQSSPPQFKGGTVMSTHEAWTRSVSVIRVAANDLTTAVRSDTGINRIVVTVKRGDMVLATSTAIRTRNGSPSAPLSVSPGGNAAPTAVAFADTGNMTSSPGSYVLALSATGSSDPDGDTLSYHWDMGDGTVYTTAEPTHTYIEAGTYTVTLTVSDGKGGVDTDAVILWIS